MFRPSSGDALAHKSCSRTARASAPRSDVLGRTVPPAEDDYSFALMMGGPNLVARYLVASYAYYHLDFSVCKDGTYDAICKALLAQLDGIEHVHKHLIDRGSLEAGTAFHLAGDNYPAMVRSIAERYARGQWTK